ncbi:ribonuclease T2-like [Trichomonascus vanleenenianus]|uniref:ribonuclease T2 n=1 Tax=Trichomonascus vanleenenianus TaxID=2268995 RepID=UPI003EC9BF06
MTAAYGLPVAQKLLRLDDSLHDTCPVDTPISCSINSGKDSCCYEATNGIILSTQFWDYNPATGPDDLFTLHGLWCDRCIGGYNQFCNKAWEITNVEEVLTSTNRSDLLTEMGEVWKNLGGNDVELWLHEFNKHGTCMYTLNPSCYGEGASKYQYASDFYDAAVTLFRELPTYEWLKEAGIEPSTDKRWTVKQFQDVLSAKFGKSVGILCDRHNAINQIFYYYNLKGSVASGDFVPREALSGSSNCKDGFKYLPKGSGGGGGGGGGSGKKGYLKIDGENGCLISNGKWYTSGTCGTYTKKESQFGGIELRSSKGPCDVVDGAFTCGSGVTAGQFTTEGNYVLYGGEETWSADKVPSGTTQVPIKVGSGAVNFKLKFAAK